MDKITFLGAGSTVFAKNVLGDCITTDAMREFEYALYDIDHQRLEESYMMLSNINRNSNDGKAKVVKYADRLDALHGAKYVINCIQVGGYDPCTITDFEIPKKYGLRQTIGDTHGIGGMFRALRTIPVMLDFRKTWRRSVLMHSSSIIQTPCPCYAWRCSEPVLSIQLVCATPTRPVYLNSSPSLACPGTAFLTRFRASTTWPGY